MTMQECYKAIGGNYEAVLGRLHSEALIQRFTLKFLEDQSYLQLKQALENKNYEDAFRSAYTLKGVCQNLSFDRLYEVRIMKTHSELGAAIIKDMDFPQDHPLVHTAWEICRWHHERWDGKGYPDGLKGEEIPISAQVVSIVDVYDALTSERCYKKAFDHDTAIQMILDGQCGQFNPILLKCLKELSTQLLKMLGKGMDDDKYYHEAQRLSNEILSDKSLPNQIYSQNLIKVMQEKIDFFKSNSGINSIDYNASSGQLTIINEKQKIIYQRKDPGFDVFKVLEVSEEDIQNIVDLLEQTSIKNKEISLQIKARFENKRQMYNLKLHTLWTPLKKDGYIGIIGYFDIVK